MENLKPLSGMPLVVLTIAVSLGMFMNVLDTSITNVALRTIAGELGVSVDNGTWVITSFAASQAVMLPITGWLAKRFGEVRLFILSTTLFIITSMLCGFATNITELVLARALQGAVAGPMIPLSQSLLIACYPPERKNFAISIWSMVAVVAPVVGPILGGWISDNYSWPWIFYINLPVGIVSIVLTTIMFRGRETIKEKLPIDYMGLILLAIGISCFQVMLDRGNDDDWFKSNFITTLTVIYVIALSFFIAWELTAKHPVMDLKLFANRNFTVGTLAMGVGYFVFFSNLVIYPLWLQNNMGYTPTWAGIAAAPIGILPFFLTPFVGRYAQHFDPRILGTIGFLFFAFTAFWQSTFYTDVGFETMFPARLVQGMGMSFFFVPVIAIAVSNISPERIASALGIVYFFRSIGGSFGTSLSVTLWSRRSDLYHSRLVDNITNLNPINREYIEKLQNSGFHGAGAYAEVENMINDQAYMFSTNDIFWLSGWIFLMIVLLIWFAKYTKPKQGDNAPVSE